MKKLTLQINGAINEQDAKLISGALNDLSGIVAADVAPSEGEAYAYAGDKLRRSAASEAVGNAGYVCRVLNEEYLSDAWDYKRGL